MKVSNAILATLAYYDGFDYPLSALELYWYLINPQRLKPNIGSIEVITLSDIYRAIDELLKQESIIQELGFYSLNPVRSHARAGSTSPEDLGGATSNGMKNRTGLSALRLEREKISAQKWRRCLNRAYWLQMAPWIRGMFVSGSLALGTVNKESDFDILVLVESGRLYLARIFLSGVASLIGARRTRYETVASDKFCFNHYLTTPTLSGRGPDRIVGANLQSGLNIKHESLYNAQTYAHLVPMAVSPALAGKFFAENLWINKFVYNFTPHQQTIRRTVRPSRFLKGIAKTIEFIFQGEMGNVFERWSRQYQQERIIANPATHAPGGRVVYTNTELEFHPHSFERVILEHYNTKVSHLGITVNIEPDSGLKKP